MNVLTLGTFDVLHVGHIALLRHCRRMAGPGGTVVVAVNPDEFVTRYKGKTPAISFEDRCEMLRACRYVDIVIPNTGCEDSKPAIEWARGTKPELMIVVGSDWRLRDYLRQLQVTQKWLDERGIAIKYFDRKGDASSTAIKAKIRSDT
jgi:glycerol-3-phosphate cytidylyltransferase